MHDPLHHKHIVAENIILLYLGMYTVYALAVRPVLFN